MKRQSTGSPQPNATKPIETAQNPTGQTSPPAAPSSSPPSSAASSPFPDPIPGVIKFGTVTLFGGEARVGKSPLLLDWCARLRDERTIFGRQTHAPTAFCYIATDRGWADSYQHWADLVGFPDMPHYALADDPTFPLSTLGNEKQAFHSLNLVLDRVELAPGTFVLLDAVSPLFVAGDPNRARNVAIAVHYYRRVCRQRQITLLATVHHAKQLNDDSKQYKRLIDRMSGSGAFAGYSDCQLSMVGPTTDEPAHLFEWNPPHAAPEQFRLQRQDNGLFQYIPEKFTDELPDLNPTALALYELLPAEAKRSDIIDACRVMGINPNYSYILLKNLQAHGLIDHAHGVWKKRNPS